MTSYLKQILRIMDFMHFYSEIITLYYLLNLRVCEESNCKTLNSSL